MAAAKRIPVFAMMRWLTYHKCRRAGAWLGMLYWCNPNIRVIKGQINPRRPRPRGLR
jgi:hypothetical protein